MGGGEYYPDSNPCVDPAPEGTALLSNEGIIGVSIGAIVFVVLCLMACCCIIRLIREEKKGKPIFTSIDSIPGPRGKSGAGASA